MAVRDYEFSQSLRVLVALLKHLLAPYVTSYEHGGKRFSIAIIKDSSNRFALRDPAFVHSFECEKDMSAKRTRTQPAKLKTWDNHPPWEQPGWEANARDHPWWRGRYIAHLGFP